MAGEKDIDKDGALEIESLSNEEETPKLAEAGKGKTIDPILPEKSSEFRKNMADLGLPIEMTEAQKKMEHYRHMLEMLSRVRDNSDIQAHRYLSPESLKLLQDESKTAFFKVLVHACYKNDRALMEFLQRVSNEGVDSAIGESEGSTVTADVQGKSGLENALGPTELVEIERLAKDLEKPYQIFSSRTASSAALFKADFADFSKEEFDLLAGLLYLDIQAYHLDVYEKGRDKPSLAILERFTKAQKNYASLTEILEDKAIPTKVLKELETYDEGYLKELWDKEELTNEDIEGLKDLIKDMMMVPQPDRTFRRELYEKLGAKDVVFLDYYELMRVLLKREREDDVKAILKAQVGLTDEKRDVALEILKGSGATMEQQEFKNAA